MQTFSWPLQRLGKRMATTAVKQLLQTILSHQALGFEQKQNNWSFQKHMLLICEFMACAMSCNIESWVWSSDEANETLVD